MVSFAGPMFQPATTSLYESIFSRKGAHYNIYFAPEGKGMSFLRKAFPDGQRIPECLVLFSTSGVHGTYGTIDEAEDRVQQGLPYNESEEWDAGEGKCITFMVVQTRTVTIYYGNAEVKTLDDVLFLRKLKSNTIVTFEAEHI